MTLKTLILANEKELKDNLEKNIKAKTNDYGISIDNDSKIEGERRIARGHETVYFTYNGTVEKNVSGLFFINEKVKIIGEVWNCEKSGTSIICVGIAQITEGFGQSDEKTWEDIVQDPYGTFKDKDGNEIAGDYGLIYNVICH